MNKSILTAVSLLATVSTFAAAPANSDDSAHESVPFAIKTTVQGEVHTAYGAQADSKNAYVGWSGKIHFTGHGSENGVDYGFHGALNAYNGTDAYLVNGKFPNTNATIDTASIFVGTDTIGTFTIGQTWGASIYAGRVPGFSTFDEAIIGGMTSMDIGWNFFRGAYSEKWNKVIYTLPHFDGFSAFVSYTPYGDTYRRSGFVKADFESSTNDSNVVPAENFTNIVEVSARYDADMFSVYGGFGLRSKDGDGGTDADKNTYKTAPLIFVGAEGNVEGLKVGAAYSTNQHGNIAVEGEAYSLVNIVSVGAEYDFNDDVAMNANYTQGQTGTADYTQTDFQVTAGVTYKINSAVSAKASTLVFSNYGSTASNPDATTYAFAIGLAYNMM